MSTASFLAFNIPHIPCVDNKKAPQAQVTAAQKTPTTKVSSHVTTALADENENKQFIDAALQTKLITQVWTEAEKGNAYICDLELFWDNQSKSTNPNLTTEFFTYGRTSISEQILRLIDAGSTQIIMVGSMVFICISFLVF